VGLSLGANQMLKFAGENPKCPFKVMIAVNNPFDITMNNHLMRGTIYEKYLIKATIQNVVSPDTRVNFDIEKNVFKEMETKFSLDFDRLNQIQTWRDFDDQFTIKVNPHFKSAIAYHNAASSLNSLHNIKVPTLVLHAKDDKITPVRCVPVEDLL
jgi:predicted alpha/beta-fold hydrolase